MPYTGPERDFDDILHSYIIGYDLDWADPEFTERLLDAAWADLKTNERYEHYEQCHQLKLFIEWVNERF